MKTISRMKSYINAVVCYPETKIPCDGPLYTRQKAFGHESLGVIAHFKNGLLHNDEGPAVEFEDAHTEYWKNGVLHNDQVNANGLLMPAIISDYDSIHEYWIHGEKVPSPV